MPAVVKCTWCGKEFSPTRSDGLFHSKACKQQYWRWKHRLNYLYSVAHNAIGEIEQSLGGALVAEAPRCSHGTMIWKQAAAGSPKNWGGYFCTERTKATQCAPNWHVLASDGKWKPQV